MQRRSSIAARGQTEAANDRPALAFPICAMDFSSRPDSDLSRAGLIAPSASSNRRAMLALTNSFVIPTPGEVLGPRYHRDPKERFGGQHSSRETRSHCLPSSLAGLAAGLMVWSQRHRALRSLAQHAESASSNGSTASSSAPRRLSGSVYLWQTPLTLPPPFPPAFAEILPRHSVVLVECADGGVMAFDFEPTDKDAPSTAAVLLTGGSVPGGFGAKKLRRLPRGARRVGPAKAGLTVEDILSVNDSYNSQLSLSGNDCNAYSSTVLSETLVQPAGETGTRLYSTLDLDALEASGELVYKEPSLLGAVILVAGTTVGAGILALPAVTQPVGFVPSSAALVWAWIYMATTGLLIAEVALGDMASSGKVATSLQSMASKTIGEAGAALSSLSFIIVHFGLLVAYLSRGGELLAAILPAGLASGVPPPVLFAAAFGGLIFVSKGTDALERANNLFAVVVLLSFTLLVGLALPAADPHRLESVADWSKTGTIIPTLLLSLVYHNVVPTVCAQLEGDRQKVTTAIVLGSFLPLLMFLVWNGVILAAVPPGAGGADPLDTLRSAGGSALANGVIAFSLSAIITSFIGFVVALTDFFADALGPSSGESKGLEKVRDFGLTLGPPLAVACYDPSLFFQAIDKAGAFGVSMLFGLLPAWMAWAKRVTESPVLRQEPGFLGGYVRGPLVPGGVVTLLFVGGVALAVVLENLLELFQ